MPANMMPSVSTLLMVAAMLSLTSPFTLTSGTNMIKKLKNHPPIRPQFQIFATPQSTSACTDCYNLIIDTACTIHSKNKEKPAFVDGALVSDLLIEAFGAQTVVATKAEETADIFDEPDIDYSAALAEAHASGSGISQSLNLLPSDTASAHRRKREVWSHAEIVARMSRSADVTAEAVNVNADADLEAEKEAAVVINGLQYMLSDDNGDVKLVYRTESVDSNAEDDVDWCSEVQKTWPPSLITEDVVASLLFHTDEDCEKVIGEGKSYDKIMLEGGSAFGTGDHPTAKLCGEWLLDVCSSKANTLADGEVLNVMDYGAGSGILSLIALLAAKRDDMLDRIRVEGVEVDPIAIETARRNCVMNEYDVPDKLEFYAPMMGTPGSELWDEITMVVTDDPTSVAQTLPEDRKGSYDILIANIISQPLISLSSTFAMLSKSGGRIALSGVQLIQVDAVLDAYRPYYSDMRQSKELDGWVRLEGHRD